MSNMRLIKPIHNASLYVSYHDGAAWSTWSDYTDFLHDRSLSVTLEGSGAYSVNMPPNDKIRLAIYYDTPTELDCVYLCGLTQSNGLTINVYADDVEHPAVPATLVTTKAQVASPRLTSNEYVEFTPTTAKSFVVEIDGVAATGIDLQGRELLKYGRDGWHHKAYRHGQHEPYFDIKYKDRPDPYSHTQDDIRVLSDTDVSYTAVLNYLAASLAEFKVVNKATNEVIHNKEFGSNVSTEYENGTITEFFTIPANTTEIEFKIDSRNSYARFNIVYQSLVPTSMLTGYKHVGLDIRSVVFGRVAWAPKCKITYGSRLATRSQYDNQQTRYSQYQQQKYSPRVFELNMKQLTDTDINSLQELDYQLRDGYCVYVREDEHFIAYLGAKGRTPTAINFNEEQITLMEAHQWQ